MISKNQVKRKIMGLPSKLCPNCGRVVPETSICRTTTQIRNCLSSKIVKSKLNNDKDS